MQADIKKKWIAALRSGKYQQGEGALRERKADDDGNRTGEEQYCCLGVLCDIVEPKQWLRGEDNQWKNGNAEVGGFPREELQKKLGLDKPCSRAEDADTIAEKLAHMNDEGKSFKYIANWIEKKAF